jgi:K+-transporting ATPase ATPase C chain
MISQLKPALMMLLALTVVTGVLYPLAITGIAQLIFPEQAGGSLVMRGDSAVGSSLIGQTFNRPGYFRSRPSAAGAGYDATMSGGSNLGPTSAALAARVDSLALAYGVENPGVPIPIDLVTASASGLDPHISPAAAEFQIPRVARERGIPQEDLRSIVRRHVEGRQFGLLGEPRVNVLALNLALEAAQTTR